LSEFRFGNESRGKLVVTVTGHRAEITSQIWSQDS